MYGVRFVHEMLNVEGGCLGAIRSSCPGKARGQPCFDPKGDKAGEMIAGKRLDQCVGKHTMGWDQNDLMGHGQMMGLRGFSLSNIGRYTHEQKRGHSTATYTVHIDK